MPATHLRRALPCRRRRSLPPSCRRAPSRSAPLPIQRSFTHASRLYLPPTRTPPLPCCPVAPAPMCALAATRCAASQLPQAVAAYVPEEPPKATVVNRSARRQRVTSGAHGNLLQGCQASLLRGLARTGTRAAAFGPVSGDRLAGAPPCRAGAAYRWLRGPHRPFLMNFWEYSGIG
jgi:hypothetical protein